MTGTPRSKDTFLERLLPERRIYIKSGETDQTGYLCVTPRLQALGLGVGAVTLLWSVTATFAVVVGMLSADGSAMQARVIQDAQEARIAELSAERDQRAREAAAMRDRFSVALASISEFQTQLLSVQKDRDELKTALGLMQDKLQVAVESRDIASENADTLMAELQEVSGDLSERNGRETELAATLDAVSGALSNTVEERDRTVGALIEMEDYVAAMEFEARVEADKQERMFAQLESAVSVTMGPLEQLLAQTGQDVEGLVTSVKSQYSGEGGPFIPTAFPGGEDDNPIHERYARLMTDLDRVHLMHITSSQIPFANPVRGTVRYTSSFGKRRDPINGRLRDHNGQDLAGPPGTPILAAGDGKVVFAGRQGGYGNLVKIRHGFGYETVYAHLKEIKVSVGDTVTRGDVIGGMGNTGRSTGTHLHYEIRVEGQAVNPMPYMKAAKDVF